MTETTAQKIARRQQVVRAHMLRERAHDDLFELLVAQGSIGELVDRRWWLFGQVALHSNGALLGTDTAWADIKREIGIPSALWMGTMTNARTLASAQKVLSNRSTYRFPSTTYSVSGTTMVGAPTWWVDDVRRVKKIDILAWLGVIGGRLNPR
jgi:hypothetical protein